MRDEKKLSGAGAENTAAEFLKTSGYRIIDRNYRSPYGEIDIIAGDGGCLAFVEVKYRSGMDFGGPAAAVARRKQERIIKTALHYLKARKLLGREARFDVVAIGPGDHEIELIKNAFESLRGSAY